MGWNVRTHNGAVTMVNHNTGDWRTIEIKTQPDDARFAPGKRVAYLVTPDIVTNGRMGFGFVDPKRGIQVWRRHRGTKFEKFADMINHPRKYMALGVEYKPEGRCRVCNRQLTNPESIDLGIGPVCGGRV